MGAGSTGFLASLCFSPIARIRSNTVPASPERFGRNLPPLCCSPSEPTIDTSSELIEESGDIETPAEEVQVESGPVAPAPVEEAPVDEAGPSVRFARAIQVTDDVVDGVLRVAVDEQDKAVGFTIPYGSILVVLGDEDDRPCAPGWLYVDGQFLDPNE